MSKTPRLMVAAPRSGSGKTLVSCGLLRLMQRKGIRPSAFKCGPDFVDPGFHRQVLGLDGRNLDGFFTDDRVLRNLLVKGAEGADMALLEGAMGYYDGMTGDSAQASSYHVATATGTPVVLVLDARGASLSLAAQIHGMATFREDANIKGVILNRCSPSLYAYLAKGVEIHSGVPLLGYIPEAPVFALDSRHLGLVSAAEISHLQDVFDHMADTMENTLDWDRIQGIAEGVGALEVESYRCHPVTALTPRLAVARDSAFCFCYRENLDMMTELGAELVYFSPLNDKSLPPDIDGLYLSGGYPELHAARLSENQSIGRSIREAVAEGLPTVAEGGGFLYLQEELMDEKGVWWAMANLLPGRSQNIHRLKQFGYITLAAQQDNLYGQAGTVFRGHEFHYWHAEMAGRAYLAEKPNGRDSWPCIVAEKNLLAGFPHAYYPSNPSIAEAFVLAMAAHKESMV